MNLAKEECTSNGSMELSKLILKMVSLITQSENEMIRIPTLKPKCRIYIGKGRIGEEGNH